MDDNDETTPAAPEPEHIFQVVKHGRVYYVAADVLAVMPTGVIMLANRTGPFGTTEPVAVIAPCADTSVVRVDALLNQEGMDLT